MDLMIFLTNYFQANHCEIKKQNHHQLQVKLTEEMDRALMNRPFYWQYIKSLGKEGEPLTLSLQLGNTSEQLSDDKFELIHFGSPRLHTIFNDLKQKAQFTRLFEKITTTENTMLFPWLVINLIVSYEGRLKKEELFSIGLQLINGTIVFNMMEKLNKRTIDEQISNYCYTITPLIKLESGFLRILNVVKQQVNKRCHKWIEESEASLNKEIQLINHFYDQLNDQDKKEKEIEQAKKRYKPKININPFSGGLFYLTDSFLRK